MNPRLPRITGEEMVRCLSRIDSEVIRIKGSHHFLRHPDGRTTVIPVHAGEILGPGLMSKILHDTDITRERLIELL